MSPGRGEFITHHGRGAIYISDCTFVYHRVITRFELLFYAIAHRVVASRGQVNAPNDAHITNHVMLPLGHPTKTSRICTGSNFAVVVNKFLAPGIGQT